MLQLYDHNKIYISDLKLVIACKTISGYLRPPPLLPDEPLLLLPDEPLLPPELVAPEVPLLGGRETAGLLPPEDGLAVLTEGVLRVGAEGLASDLPDDDPLERLSGRLYVALLPGLEYVELPEEDDDELLLCGGVTLLV